MSQITVTNPLTGERTVVESNPAEVSHGVDATGLSLGMAALGTAFALTPEPPSGTGWKWDFELEGWIRTPLRDEVLAQSLIDIDAAAGSARLRYITDVPGQQAVYMAKQAEAEDFLANGGTPGAYLQGEADARGVTVTQAAQMIAGLAAMWGETIGPAIEKSRIAGKLAAGAAQTVPDVLAAADAAINALDSI